MPEHCASKHIMMLELGWDGNTALLGSSGKNLAVAVARYDSHVGCLTLLANNLALMNRNSIFKSLRISVVLQQLLLLFVFLFKNKCKEAK